MKQPEHANRLVKSQSIDAKHKLTKKCKWGMKICIKIQLETRHSVLTKMCVCGGKLSPFH